MEKKCGCGPKCNCGCQEGKKCTCKGECTCGNKKETKKKCDGEKSVVTIYPKKPYGKTDYKIEVSLECGFKK